MTAKTFVLECDGACTVPDRRILSSGALLLEVPLGEQIDEQYFADAPRLPSGTRYRAYHLSCFSKLMDEFQRLEQRTACFMAIAPIADLQEFFSIEFEEGMDDQ
jgi:hypothetical protein